MQKALLIAVNFQNEPAYQPISIASLQNYFFGTGPGTVNGFFTEGSYGRMSFSGTVAGYYTLPMNSPQDLTTMNDIINASENAAKAAGFDLSQYSFIFYVCEASTGPCSQTTGEVGFAPNFPVRKYFVGGADSTGSFYLATIVHEVGHLMGLEHSHAFAGGTSVSSTGAVVPKSPSGATPSFEEYDDYYDAMGLGHPEENLPFHYNAFQKERLGWLNAPGAPSILTVTKSGTYQIEPYETSSSGGAKALKIVRQYDPTNGMSLSYYLECRRSLGNFDSAAFAATYRPNDLTNVLSGPLIHLVINGNWPDREMSGAYSYASSVSLLDMTPGSQTGLGYNTDVADPALGIGHSFVDADGGITITTSVASDSGCTVNVTLGSAGAQGVRRLPNISVSPVSSDPVSSGTTVTYNVTVTNLDDASVGQSSFAMSASDAWYGAYITPDWTHTFSPSVLTLSPGQSASTTLSVTSSPTTGTSQFPYPVFISAVNLGMPYFIGANSVKYACYGPAGSDTTPPSLSFDSPAPGAVITSYWLDANASVSDSQTWITKVEFYVDGVLTVTDTIPAWGIFVPAGNYSNGPHTITAKAYDAAGNVATASLPITIQR